MDVNPLLAAHSLPPFSQIRAEHVGPALRAMLEQNLKALSFILIDQQSGPTWEGLVQPLEDLNQRLLAVRQPIQQLAAQLDRDDIALAYGECLDQVVRYETALEQNQTLFGLLTTLEQSPQAGHFSPVRRAALASLLREARLAGVGYDAQVLSRGLQLKVDVEALQTRFGRNAQVAQTAWARDVKDESELDGISLAQKQLMAEQAQANDVPGWRLTLDFPTFVHVQTHAHRRELRQAMYLAFHTQASDQSAVTGSDDNGPVIEQLLATRLELANLLGHRSYAQRAMATRMFDAPEDVEAMLLQLLAEIRPAAQAELDGLNALAELRGAPALAAWDVDYYKELYRRAHFGVAESAVREYFPIPAVLRGLAAMVQQLFSVQMRECQGVERWHEQVRVFELRSGPESLGHIYFDLYARAGKAPGVWMQGLRDRHRFADDHLQLPIASLSCDFFPGASGTDAQLDVAQLTNLLHEFGHALHHVLTRVEHGSVAGIKGIAEDAVEFPSRLFEAWAREPASLALLSAHCDTGETIPEAFLTQVLDSQQAFQAMDMLYQLEYSLLDLRLHRQVEKPQLMPIVRSVLAEVEILATPPEVRYTHTFAHLFATQDYASGYYTYVWSQVLAAETFARFKREGVLSAAVGAQLRELILGQGGTLPIGELLERFTGRKPSIDALLASMDIAVR